MATTTRTCDWCGEPHTQAALCGERPSQKVSRRWFIGSLATALAGLAVRSVPTPTSAPQLRREDVLLGSDTSAEWGLRFTSTPLSLSLDEFTARYLKPAVQAAVSYAELETKILARPFIPYLGPIPPRVIHDEVSGLSIRVVSEHDYGGYSIESLLRSDQIGPWRRGETVEVSMPVTRPRYVGRLRDDGSWSDGPYAAEDEPGAAARLSRRG